ncbi:MAG TPA: XRE family transcriptional regulator [Acetomicrobium flavidum]|uniref:SOS response transcriptional repressor, RecA-mediated autopeptidase n=1 Tax=Acetomicrobium mobile (strain ATCC BAA-54 / DSM 13181 / JCM 12221 / NGA) TaxID=891968 RepID=I4BXM5_ACEMN|nr:XRE family transcriptional regulator [Acetomicrobium mobile]AFM22032.1 SOS response transcriptional repressor, RecA-mediated autopeptidase [Acetomicrobium mobile DSM 13181]HOP88177.1 XRE family transcriptional regulator [Acetomicrobium flavidum]
MLGERIRTLRKEIGMSVTELARRVKTSPSHISEIERGEKMPSLNLLVKIAKELKTSIDYLTGLVGFAKKAMEVTEVALLDKASVTAAGRGFDQTGVYHDVEDMVYVPDYALGPVGEVPPFAVRVAGESMIGAGITDNSIVVVNPSAEVGQGDVALVAIGNEWTVKYIYTRADGSLELRPANSSYSPMLFSKEDLASGLVKVIGKVVWIIGKPKKEF